MSGPTPNWMSAAFAAQILLDSLGIRGVLVGTAGLCLHDVWTAAPDMDVDFFVEMIPDHLDVHLMEKIPGTYMHRVGTWMTEFGVEVQFIANDRAEARRFLTENPKVVAGVRLAKLKDILGLKKWGNREKDRLFFEYHPEFAKLVEDVEPCPAWDSVNA